jgi:hypothetical protein
MVGATANECQIFVTHFSHSFTVLCIFLMKSDINEINLVDHMRTPILLVALFLRKRKLQRFYLTEDKTENT